jgi:hypothetical protein
LFATTTGGGSSADGFHIYSSTLYGNNAPGNSTVYFYNDPSGLGMGPDFQNTLVSGGCAQSGAGTAPTFYGLLGNIESPGNTCGFGIFSHENVPDANLLLGALGNNGGPTPTHLPLAGSVLIDAGWRYVCTSLDQRGYVRADGNPYCDTGSVEAGALDDVIFRDGFDI